jgi:hypothetical protein
MHSVSRAQSPGDSKPRTNLSIPFDRNCIDLEASHLVAGPVQVFVFLGLHLGTRILQRIANSRVVGLAHDFSEQFPVGVVLGLSQNDVLNGIDSYPGSMPSAVQYSGTLLPFGSKFPL